VNRRFRSPDGTRAVGRNWEGVVDHTVRVARFDDYDEAPVATMLHYACHPTTMAWQKQLFAPDYPGVARDVVEKQVGGMCIFLQGAAGNLTTRRGFTGDARVYRRLGSILGLRHPASLWRSRRFPGWSDTKAFSNPVLQSRYTRTNRASPKFRFCRWG
jgi:hypothetical protein